MAKFDELLAAPIFPQANVGYIDPITQKKMGCIDIIAQKEMGERYIIMQFKNYGNVSMGDLAKGFLTCTDFTAEPINSDPRTMLPLDINDILITLLFPIDKFKTSGIYNGNYRVIDLSGNSRHSKDTPIYINTGPAIRGKYYLDKDDTITIDGKVLSRVLYVGSSLLGGYVESEDNLSQQGTCQLLETGRAYGNAKIVESARVLGTISDDAVIKGSAVLSPSGTLSGKAVVQGRATVSGQVTDSASVKDSAVVSGIVSGQATVAEFAVVSGSCTDSAVVKGHAILSGEASGSAIIAGPRVYPGTYTDGTYN
jgi:hypothetical protein